MYCGADVNVTHSGDDDDGEGVTLCYRSLIYLGLPVLFCFGGFCFALVQETKLRRKRTLFPLRLVARCIGGVDCLRLVLFFLTGLAPLVIYLFERDGYKDDTDGWPSHRFVDTIVIGILPWILLACTWVLHEVRRGSQEWFWLRLYCFIEVIGESLRFWSEMRNLDVEFSDDGHQDYILVTGVVRLTLKVLCLFAMNCFNRDWRRLRKELRSSADKHGLGTSMISVRNESFIAEADVENIENLVQGLGSDGSSSSFHQENLERTPEQYAGLLSRLLFYWLEPLMQKGYKRPLEDTDFYKLLREDETQTLSRAFAESFKEAKLEQELANELKSVSVQPTDDHYTRLEEDEDGGEGEDGSENESGEKPKEDKLVEGSLTTIVKALHRAGILRPFYEAAFFKWAYDTLTFVGPQLLKHLIKFLSDDDRKNDTKGYLFAGLMCATSLLQTFVLHIYFHRAFRAGMRVRSTLVTSIYRKSLRLTPSARQYRTTGEVVNLMSTDCERLNGLFPYLHVMWSAPYQLALAMYFLWAELEYAVLVAVVIIFILMTPLTAFVGKSIKNIQKKLMKVKDNRLRVTGEVITSIKAIKCYGWEKTFRNMVEDARGAELKLLKKYVIWRAAARTLWSCTPILVTLATFAAFIWLGGTLDAATAFTSLSLLNILRFPLAVLPNIFNSAIEASVSLKRIASFLYSEEVDFNAIEDIKRQTKATMKDDGAVVVSKGNFFWDDKFENQALHDVNFDLKQGEVCIVTGEVGSGKSALLGSLIGDLQPTHESRVGVVGKVSYAAQVAWIQNASLRDNVLFGAPYDRQWYNHVIWACSLTADIELLPEGDATEIGERGINLSGGQKARVALARAVYSRADILLLETCFEAVDEHVGAFLWKECFNGILKEPNPLTGRKRTTIVVTHALKYAHEADKILVMKKGRIVEQGKYSDIVKDKDSELAKLNVQLEAKVEEEKEKETSARERSESDISASHEDERPPKVLRKLSSFTRANRSKKEGGDLTGKEEKLVGDVGWAVFKQYLAAIGGPVAGLSVLIGFTLRSGLDVGTSTWLAYWSGNTKEDDGDENIVNSTLGSLYNRVLFNNHDELYDTLVPDSLEFLGSSTTDGHSTGFYLGIYALLSFTSLLFVGVLTLYIAFVALKASKTMHQELLTAIVRAPMSYFDTTPIGRILNRFSKDIYTIDESLPDSTFSLCSTAFTVMSTIITIAVVVPVFLGVLPFLAVGYAYVQRYYIASSREVKRWDSVLRSPIYSFFSESLDGVSTIRAYGVSRRFIRKNEDQLNKQLGAYYISIAANRWLAVRLETLGNMLSTSTALFVVVFSGSMKASLAALAVSYSLSVTQSLNWTVRMSAEMETNLVSVERLNEYIATEPEAPNEDPDPTKVPAPGQWPTKGEIVFDNVSARYREGLDRVLKNVTFTVAPGEKVGLVGRTGSGKSSSINLLLRIIEPCEGRILIDGYDTRLFGVERLRQAIALIPQDPIMFQGTLRTNLDPMKAFSEAEIWNALEITHLKEHVEGLLNEEDSNSEGINSALDIELVEGGSTFSFGQRQLICIARALLRRTRIICLDEASSALDFKTDELIQQMIRVEFKDATVLTVAHRLNTIADSDKILVLEQGEVAEYDTPDELLKNRHSLYSKLVQQMSESNKNNNK